MLYGDVKGAIARGLLPERYLKALSEAIKKADTLADGRYALEGEDYFLLQTYAPKDKQDASFEIHRKYIDIQVMLSGREIMYVADAACVGGFAPFDEAKDIAKSAQQEAEAEVALLVNAGQFALFFPEDAHRPSCKSQGDEGQTVRKLVVKLRL